MNRRKGASVKGMAIVLFSALWLCSCQQKPTATKYPEGRFRITQNGRAHTTIVVAEGVSHSAIFAATELKEHIQKISGAELPMISDNEPVKTANRILVGESRETRKLGYRNGDFQAQEFMVKSLPNTLILMGRDKQAPEPSRFKTLGNVQLTTGKLGGKALAFKEGVLKIDNCFFSEGEGSIECLAYIPKNGSGIIANVSAFPGTYRLLCRNGQLIYIVQDGVRKELGGRGLVKSTEIKASRAIKGWHRILATYSLKNQKMALYIDGRKVGENHFAKTFLSDGNGTRVDLGGYYADYRYDDKANPCAINKSLWVAQPFNGKIEEFALADEIRKPSTAYSALSGRNNTLLLRFGIQNKRYIDLSGRTPLVTPPYSFDDQGSSYAVHEFLEKFCDVRWYGPTDLGMVYPKRDTLTVYPTDIRRTPALKYRQVQRAPFLSNVILYNYPSRRAWALFLNRLKAGGERFIATHGIWGYDERFLNKNSSWFEGKAEALWAKRVHQPKDNRFRQLCFNSPEAIKQVVQDAREYFNGEKHNYRTQAAGNYFAVAPSDHAYFCECSGCVKQIADTSSGPYKFYGRHSNYVFAYANRIAKELKKSHPDKYLGAIAYQAYLDVPTHVELDPMVAVKICTDFQAMYRPGVKKRVTAIYQNWLQERSKSNRRLYACSYFNFPASYLFGYCTKEAHHPFPVFAPRATAQTFKTFAKDGIKGFDHYGAPRQLAFYLMYRIADDPTIDTEETIADFFRLYYGGAAPAMKAFWMEMENAISDPGNFPTPNSYTYSEATSWGELGSDGRMEKLAGYIQQATETADTAVTKKRVQLFKDGLWTFMQKGKESYSRKLLALCPTPTRANQVLKSLQKMKSLPPPEISVPLLSIDPECGMDWAKAVSLKPWRHLNGLPATEKQITTQLAHDGENLYIRLIDRTPKMELKAEKGKIWGSDVVELFFAEKRGSRPYRQLAASPTGEYKGLAYPDNVGGTDDWHVQAVIKSETGKAGEWILELSLPLKEITDKGVKAGDSFYANFYRATANSGPNSFYAWSPNFTDSFHTLDRLGKLMLQSK